MFCGYCGKKIPDGSVCTCAKAREKASIVDIDEQETVVIDYEDDYGNQEGNDYDYGNQRGNGYDYGNQGGNGYDYGNQRGNGYDYGNQGGNGYDYGNQGGNGYDYGNQDGNKHSIVHEKKNKGIGFVISSFIITIISLVCFLVVKIVFSAVLLVDFSGIGGIIIYLIPGIFAFIGCILALCGIIFSKKMGIKIAAIIAIILSGILTGLSIYSMVNTPWRKAKKAAEEVLDQQEDLLAEILKETEAVSDDPQNEILQQLEGLKEDYELGYLDYADVRSSLNEFDREDLDQDNKDLYDTLLDSIENDLTNSIQSMLLDDEYLEAYENLDNYIDRLGSDDFCETIKNRYRNDLIDYVEKTCMEYADNEDEKAAKDFLDSAEPYIDDSSVYSNISLLIDETIADIKSNELEDEYVFAESNSRYLTSADLEGKTLREINYAKNEIYARHGRKFKSKELQNYFNSKSWYSGTIEPSNFREGVFNKYERKNIQILKDREFSMAPKGYQLDQ